MCVYCVLEQRKAKKVLNLYAIELFFGRFIFGYFLLPTVFRFYFRLFLLLFFFFVFIFFLALAECKSILQSVYVNGCVVCMYEQQRMSWHRRRRHFVWYLVIYINIETYFSI